MVKSDLDFKAFFKIYRVSLRGDDLTTAATPPPQTLVKSKVSKNEAEPELREKEERTGSTKTSETCIHSTTSCKVHNHPISETPENRSHPGLEAMVRIKFVEAIVHVTSSVDSLV